MAAGHGVKASMGGCLVPSRARQARLIDPPVFLSHGLNNKDDQFVSFSISLPWLKEQE